jgi:hypothetical protein
MTFTAPKLLAGLISALLGFTALVGPQEAESSPSRVTLDVAPFLIEPSTTTSSTLFIDPYATAAEQFAALAVNLGWPVSEYDTLVKVITRESNAIAIAHNSNDPMGGSYGLMQINGFWCRGANSYLQKAGLLTSCEMLLDPQINLRAGLIIFTRSGWSPWRTAK